MLRAATYFVFVFGAGFILGVFRVLWLEPRIGARLAEIGEAPLMLVAIFFSARFVIRHFPASRSQEYLVSGGLALLLLILVEFSVVLGLRGLSISEYFAERDPISGGVYIFMLIVFALMPWFIGRTSTAT
jgi:hypothetical protein